jgi:monoamine oxidase
MALGGGPGFVFGIKGASQDSRPVGGMGVIYHKVATELGGRAPELAGAAHLR